MSHNGSHSTPFSTRPWREIAGELAAEADPKRIIELAKELDRALAEQMPMIEHDQKS
jgi:hypothetical protein